MVVQDLNEIQELWWGSTSGKSDVSGSSPPLILANIDGNIYK